jgi:two-component system, cell cycle sensor histidine kinase and response regulator CckA
MNQVLRVLQVEDSESDAALIVRLLQKAGHDVRAERVEDADTLRAALARQMWDVIVADYRLPGFDAPAALQVLHETGLDLPFIVVSGTIGEDVAVAMMKAGAHDYLIKGNLARLAPAVEREIRDAQVRQERKRAESALRESEAALRQLCDSALDAIVMIDEDGRTILSNPAAELMFGYTAGEMSGQAIHDLVLSAGQAPDLNWNLRAFRAAGQGPRIGKVVEATARRKDGSQFPVELSLGAIHEGQRWRAVAIVRDVTATYQARKQIEEANHRYHSLAEQSRTMIWEVNADGLYSYVSQVSETVWGYRPEELVGKKHFYDIHSEERREAFKATAFETIARKGCFRDLEHPVRTKNGRTVWVSTNGIPILNDEGELLGYRGSSTDITERKGAEEERRHSEQRYRSLFENMQNGFTYCKMLYDDRNRPVDFVTLDVNDAFERVTRLRGVVGRPVSEVIPGIREAMPEFFEVQGRVAMTGKPESFELDFKPIGRWLSVSVYSPEKGYFVALFDDITERKRNEADREAMVALLRLLNSPNDTRELIRAVTGLVQEWSGSEAVGVRLQDGDDFPYYETRGFPPEFVEAENYLCARDLNAELVLDSQCNPVLQCICGNILNGRFESLRPFLTPGGSFWTNSITKVLAEITETDTHGRTFNRCHGDGFESVALVPLRSSGRVLGLLQLNDRRPGRFDPELIVQMERAAASLAIAVEQRQTQAALRASEERYRLISENTADVIWLLDVETNRYTFVSPSVQHMFGYSPDELMAAGLRLTLGPESYQRAANWIAEALAGADASIESSRTQVHQIDQVRKDGSIVRTEVSTTLLPRQERRRREVLGVTRDVTERLEGEARLTQAQKLESVGRLAGGVAHDFNNLLTVINGYSAMIMEQLAQDDPLHEFVTEIRTAGERAAALSGQLLVLSRKQVIQPKEVNLNDIIVEVKKMLGRVIGEDVKLDSLLSSSLGSVLGDPGQLHQILMNLAVNARDAMPNGGTLLIETANVDLDDSFAEEHGGVTPGPYVRLRVSDTGTGMTKEVLSHLFEPFFTTKQPGQGTGLGLATVYGIVKQNGGSVWVESELGCGTSFTICLPRIESVAVTHEAPKLETSVQRGTETILVVEDQEQLRKMAVRVLRGHGYRVYEAADPDEALLLAERHPGPIHLLLTDIVMPGMSGCALADRLKQSRPILEIIFMSGYSEHATLNRQELESAGAYLAKPFSPEALASKVREVLGPLRRGGTILVADDESGIRSFVRNLLEGAGYQVLEAKNGREAAQRIETTEFDLLITDLAMSEQEGIETIQKLHHMRPGLKIIAMSGQLAGTLLEATMVFGAMASIAKPLQPNELLDVVARVLHA